MAIVVLEATERISEHGECLIERDAMLCEICGRLAGIPFKGQSHGPNVLDNLGIRLTPQLSCKAFK